MTFSVVHRMIAGFSMLAIGLIIIGVIGIRSIINIGDRVTELVETATPVSQLTSELVNVLIRSDQTMIAHYNSTDPATQNRLEALSAEQQADTEQKTIQLQSMLSAIEDSETAQQEVALLIESLPVVFASIQEGMKTYRDSIDRLEKLKGIYLQLAENEVNLLAAVQKMVEEAETPNGTALAYKLQVEILTGLKKLGVLNSVNSTQEFATAQAEFRKWLDQYSKLGFQMLKLQRTDAGIKNNFKPLGAAMSTMLNLVTANDGLLPIQSNYLQIKASLSNQIAESSQAMQTDVTLLEQISEFAASYQKRVNQSSTEAITSNISIIILTSLIIIALAIVIAFFITRSIRKPLDYVITVLARIADGDLKQNIEQRSNDEFGVLIQNTIQLSSNLKSMIAVIDQQSSLLKSTVAETRDISDQTASDISHQKTEIEMVATAMNEMSATAEEVATSANLTAEEMTTIETASQNGLQVVNENKQNISMLADDMADTGVIVRNLDKEVHDIETVLAVIQSIAEQTNLLALNAAIEAARAGEQGRGFAVVADEVRSLASRTQSSTVEIKEMIEKMLAGSNKAVEAIEASQEKTDTGVQRATAAAETINQIADGINKIRDMNLQIATASQQQSSTSREISENIIRISTISEHSELAASKTNEHLQNLLSAADSLQDSIRKFQI